MIKKISINGIYYNVENGINYNDKATEELDTLTFNINNANLKLKTFDEAVITFTNNTTKTMLVNTWIDEIATYNGLRNYTISCISETKKLERVQLPNLTITQPLGLSNNEKRKYDKYLNKILPYIQKAYPTLHYSNRLLDKMSTIVAVEEQFNSPNAKEYLNTILAKINAVVVVNNNEIDYFDLSKEGNAIDSSKVLFNNNYQTIEDYYSDIITDLQGVQSEEPTIYKEVVGIRSPENAVVTYDNAVIKLEHNINFIKEVKIWIKYRENAVDKTRSVTIYGDNYKLIKEKAEYDLLKVSNALNDNSLDLKRNNLFFVRGNNTIEGLTYNEKTWFVGISSVTNAIQNVINIASNNEVSYNDDIRELKFEVTYSALDDVSTRFEKSMNATSEIRDNQTDSYIDLDKFAKTQQEKINRLGNEVLEINARYSKNETLPNLMDTLDNYVLAERQILYYSNYIDFKGILYKDYVKKNVFYGVDAKRRSTQLILGKEATTRKEIVKDVYQFAFANKGFIKDTQRYLLGKIVTANYNGEPSNKDKVNSKWTFDEEFAGSKTSTIMNEDINYYFDYAVITSNGTYYQCNQFTFVQIEDDSTGTLILGTKLYYYLNGERTLVYDNGWVNESYRNIYPNIDWDEFNQDNNISVEEFVEDVLMWNGTPTYNNLQPDENNYYENDFKPIQMVKCKSIFNEGSSVEYKLEPDVRKANNSVTINLKWYDNINVGMKLNGIKPDSLAGVVDANGGYGQEYVTYTDKNGELTRLQLYIYDKIGYEPSSPYLYDLPNMYPEVPAELGSNNNILYYKSLDINKDNREILNTTIQLEIIGNNDIFVTDRFITYTPFFKQYKNLLYVYISTQEYYNKYNYNKVVSSATKENNIKIDYSDFLQFQTNYNAFNRLMLYNNNVDLTNVKSWAIADEDGNVYVAVNKRDTDAVIPTTIYLNKKGE